MCDSLRKHAELMENYRESYRVDGIPWLEKSVDILEATTVPPTKIVNLELPQNRSKLFSCCNTHSKEMQTNYLKWFSLDYLQLESHQESPLLPSSPQTRHCSPAQAPLSSLQIHLSSPQLYRV